jgi:hypothetical protein
MSRAAASRMSPESDMPAPTATSSPWNSARLRIPPSFSTIPWIVWSGEEHVVAAAQHHQRQPLLGGEGQRVANIVQILGDDEELGRTADSQ